MAHLDRVEWLGKLREHELDFVFERVPFQKGGRLLEIGGGTGHQARLLTERGWDVVSIDLPSSAYTADRVFPIIDYDGNHIPCEDASFDVVFSSNVLEHVAHLDAFEREIARVLKPGGYAVHLVPSHRWRLWSSLAHYAAIPASLRQAITRRLRPPAAAAPAARGAAPAPPAAPARPVQPLEVLKNLVSAGRHGERGNALTEYLVYFRPAWWERHFLESGWRIERRVDIELFYTGYFLLRDDLSMAARARLAGALGGAASGFVLRAS